ncbi:DUF2933 domain-containing protein [Cupriavidus neocaledonicus]|uniref:DUF2933 domain-containing protein n=2 Tax=Cupriavidus neocaledonicus TaxID=1040979 RepID=A0A375HPV2_9BURK|nr:DUF2933 domain-containing protein [Cupriavidus neocaledonicus]SOZ40905.1 conserved hypothetical protein; putative membrane protein [Cupriavidus neocaledonicus]SPD59912.1 conserved protein of unknown function [Cupriavidus neocaledonicus]
MSDKLAATSNDERVQAMKRRLSRSRLVTVGFLLVIGYFLWTEHRAHVIQALPYLLLAACPLMHLFMHHGHGHGHHRAEKRAQEGKETSLEGGDD